MMGWWFKKKEPVVAPPERRKVTPEEQYLQDVQRWHSLNSESCHLFRDDFEELEQITIRMAEFQGKKVEWIGSTLFIAGTTYSHYELEVPPVYHEVEYY